MQYLALILFLPAFTVLGWLYWKFPRTLPVTAARRAFDAAALLAAVAATVVSIAWSMTPPDAVAAAGAAASEGGPMWRQILATLAAFHVFPLVLLVAHLVRIKLFRER
jgi:hypothetical protein